MIKPYQNILLIDDDEDDREIFVSAVRGISNDVSFTGMSDAASALRKLENRDLVPEVIFLDINMPIMNGSQFLKEVKKNEALKNIPVIIFSTSSDASTIQKMKELGADIFITKPGKYKDLVDLLKPLISI